MRKLCVGDVVCSSHCAQQSERPPSPDWTSTAAVNNKWRSCCCCRSQSVLLSTPASACLPPSPLLAIVDRVRVSVLIASLWCRNCCVLLVDIILCSTRRWYSTFNSSVFGRVQFMPTSFIVLVSPVVASSPLVLFLHLIWNFFGYKWHRFLWVICLHITQRTVKADVRWHFVVPAHCTCAREFS